MYLPLLLELIIMGNYKIRGVHHHLRDRTNVKR